MNSFMVSEPISLVIGAESAAHIYQAEGADWCWSTHAPADSILRSRKTGCHLIRVTNAGDVWYGQGGPDVDGGGLGIWYGVISDSEADARRRAEMWLRSSVGVDSETRSVHGAGRPL